MYQIIWEINHGNVNVANTKKPSPVKLGQKMKNLLIGIESSNEVTH